MDAPFLEFLPNEDALAGMAIETDRTTPGFLMGIFTFFCGFSIVLQERSQDSKRLQRIADDARDKLKVEGWEKKRGDGGRVTVAKPPKCQAIKKFERQSR